MSYDTAKLRSAKPGQTAENSDNEVEGAGLYRHPNGTELITIEDPLFGNAQSEAALRVGFEYVRPAEPGEVKSIIDVQKEQVNPVTQAQEDKARLDALELESLRRFKAETEATQAPEEETKVVEPVEAPEAPAEDTKKKESK